MAGVLGSTNIKGARLRVRQQPLPLPLCAAQNTTGTSVTYSLGGAFGSMAMQAYMATTGTSGGSTKVTYNLQGSLDGSKFVSIGSSARTLTTTGKGAPIATTGLTATAYLRVILKSFTTATNTNPDKNKFTLVVAPY